jgi:hypothetical protein
MKISAQFATSLHSPEHIVAAERLGYDSAWLFDTPHESPDVWMMLALAAERTTTIGLHDWAGAGRARRHAAPPHGQRLSHRSTGGAGT